MTKKRFTLPLTLTTLILMLGIVGGARVLGIGPALAQEAPTPPPPSKPMDTVSAHAVQSDTRPKKPLSLKEAVEAAIANNMIVAIRRLDPEYAQLGVTQFEAAFDPLLNSSANYSQSKSEPQSSFQAASSKVISADVGISQTLKEGFSYDATWSSFRAEQPSLINPISPYYNSTLTLSFTQPLLRGFGRATLTTNLEISKLDVATSQETFRNTVITTLEAVEDAYWDLNSAISNYENSVQSLGLAQDLLAENQKKVEVGTLAPIQITEAKASVASRDQGVILAAASIRNAEDNLRRIMNIPPDSPEWEMAIEPTDKPEVSGETPELGSMIQTALQNRPDIIQAKTDIRIRELNYRFAQNFSRPRLDLVGAYAPSGNNFTTRPVTQRVLTLVDENPPNGFPDDQNGDGTIDNNDLVPRKQVFTDLELKGLPESAKEVFQNHNYDWNVGLNFSIPLRNRNARAGEARSKIVLEQGQLSLENLQRDIQVEVRVAVRAVITFQKAVDAARENVVLQEQKLDAEQKRYDNGMSTSFQVLTFQTDLTTARALLIASLAAYSKSVAALGRVTATLPETLGVRIVNP